jgi:hypothetical protein
MNRSRIRGARLKSASRGFNIVELSVVIIVLGLTVGMTLKGAVLIDIMKALWAGYEIQMFQNRVQLYAVQYGYLPGDDPKAANRFGHPEPGRVDGTAVIATTGDNKIDGRFTDWANPQSEHLMAWRDLRYARLLDGGDPDVVGRAALPTNPFGGIYGFDEGNLGQQKGSICLNKVPGGAAKRIDESLDDGLINQGAVVATAQPDDDAAHGHFAAPDAKPYDVDKEYIICASLLP